MDLDHFGYVLAPKALVNEKKKVRFMYREDPDNKDDSGWRFFSGDEDQEDVDNPENVGIYDIKTIIAVDPDIVKYLDSPYFSAFEKESPDEDFRVSKEFFFEPEK